jgi:hypothetical protein
MSGIRDEEGGAGRNVVDLGEAVVVETDLEADYRCESPARVEAIERQRAGADGEVVLVDVARR